MLFSASFEKSFGKVPEHLRALLMPEFCRTYRKLDQGELLSQYLSKDNFEIWKYDLELKDPASTGINIGMESTCCIFWMKTGGMVIQAPKGETKLFDTSAVILNPRFCIANFSKGTTSFWITRLKENRHLFSELTKGMQNQVALVDPMDIKVLEDLFVRPANFLKEPSIRELRLQYLNSRLLEELEVKARDSENLIKSQIEAVKLKTYLENNCGNPINFKKLNVTLDVRKHFTQIFKALPHIYLQNIRILKARKLLRDTDMPVQHIAWEVGYNSAAGFTRIFTARTRQSPLDFRNNIRKKQSATNLSEENIYSTSFTLFDEK